jgi:hypothetical protein
MNKPSALETIAGHPVTTIVANGLPIVAAMFAQSVTPWVAMVPVLAQTLASQRQSERFNQWQAATNAEVLAIKADLTNITDDQYQLVAECHVCALSTVKQAKLDYLRAAIVNTLTDPTVSAGNTEALARLIRDISSFETKLVIDLFRYESIYVLEKESPFIEPSFGVFIGTPEAAGVEGLIRLGLLQAHAPSWDATQYTWSPLAAKLIALVRTP